MWHMSARSCFIKARNLTILGRHGPVLMGKQNETQEQRAERKEAQKAAKAAKRAQREGRACEDNPNFGRKPCDQCKEMKDLLIRCRIDSSQKWFMVCGKCWKNVSGGVVDGDAAHPYYRYGGLWKNLHKQA